MFVKKSAEFRFKPLIKFTHINYTHEHTLDLIMHTCIKVKVACCRYETTLTVPSIAELTTYSTGMVFVTEATINVQSCLSTNSRVSLQCIDKVGDFKTSFQCRIRENDKIRQCKIYSQTLSILTTHLHCHFFRGKKIRCIIV